MRTYAPYLGCTIPVRATNYEMSARRVAAALELTLVDIDNFTCCGFPMKSVDHHLALTLAARNLALAGEKGAEIVTLCNACTATLTEASHRLRDAPAFREEVNGALREIGKEYRGDVRVRHFTRVLLEDVGLEKIREKVVRPLDGFRFAAHYGCHFTKPSEIYEGFDNHEHPRTLDRIIETTGATSLNFAGKKSCCGGSVLAIDESIALSMTREKLDTIKKEGADAMVLMCPFCSVMYDDNQKKVEARFERAYGLPVVYLPQMLGLAFGLEGKDLGLNQNKVSTKELLEKLSVAR